MSHSCQNSDIVHLVKEIIKSAENVGVTNIMPLSKSDIQQIKNALHIYETDCLICVNEGVNDYKCHKEAETKLMRSMPFMKKNIYPWRNYDWDYANFVDNNYSVNATGASKSGSISALFKNINAFIKLTKGYLVEANPSDLSSPGQMNKYGDIPFYECIGNIIDADSGKPIKDPKLQAACIARMKVKYRNKELPPSNDIFLKKYRLTGDRSGSYYIKIGTCPRPDIKSVKKCEAKGYDWVPNILDNIMNSMKKSARSQTQRGSCYQPRYAYIDNSPGFIIAGTKFRGLVPALAKDFMALSPDKVLATLQGKNVADLFVVQPCPTVKVESFKNYKSQIENFNNTMLIICICIVIIFIFVFWQIQKKI